MKKFIILVLLAFSLSACISVDGDTVNNSTTDNSTDYGEGTKLVGNEGNFTVAPDYMDESDVDVVIGKYDVDYTQAECTAAGFFFCTIENVCMNTPVATGTCGS